MLGHDVANRLRARLFSTFSDAKVRRLLFAPPAPSQMEPFFVISGRIAVQMFDDEGALVAEREIGPYQRLVVAPGVWHRFKVLEDSQAVETYWPAEWDPDEIERMDEGGMELTV